MDPDIRYAQSGSVSIAYQVVHTGSGLEFGERGEHALKGVPGTWRLYSVVG